MNVRGRRVLPVAQFERGGARPPGELELTPMLDCLAEPVRTFKVFARME